MMAPGGEEVPPPWRLEPECYGYIVRCYAMLLLIAHECARARAWGGNAIARGLEKHPSGDAHALQACGIDAASHFEAQCTRRWTVFSLPQEPQRCIIAVIATLMNDALMWEVQKD